MGKKQIQGKINSTLEESERLIIKFLKEELDINLEGSTIISDVLADASYDIWTYVEDEVDALVENLTNSEQENTEKIEELSEKIDEQLKLIEELESEIATWE